MTEDQKSEHQATPDSDHTGDQNATEQPAKDSKASDAGVADVIPVDRYKNLQADYTKTKQELAELRKAKNSESGDLGEDSVTAAFQALKPLIDQHYATKQDQEFRDFMSSNPELSEKSAMLKTLATHPDNQGKSYYDIAEEYNLKSSDTMDAAKAASRPLVGNRRMDEGKTKPLTSASRDEWTAWRKENLGKGPKFRI